MIDEKTCTKCGVDKAVEAFPVRDRYGKQVSTSQCRECKNSYMREYSNRPGMKQRKQRVQWQAKYKLSAESYFNLFEKQEGLCAVCSSPAATGRLLDVDHNHRCCAGRKSCGECVRGLLCNSCNGALGLVKDDVEVLKKMVAYIEAYQGRK